MMLLRKPNLEENTVKMTEKRAMMKFTFLELVLG